MACWPFDNSLVLLSSVVS